MAWTYFEGSATTQSHLPDSVATLKATTNVQQKKKTDDWKWKLMKCTSKIVNR